jgi:hypothetical protein
MTAKKFLIYLAIGTIAFLIIWIIFTNIFFIPPPQNYNAGCYYTPNSIEEFLNLTKNMTNLSQNLSW